MANITDYMHELGINARQAAQALVKATTAQKIKHYNVLLTS